jgi:hypothetical protein
MATSDNQVPIPHVAMQCARNKSEDDWKMQGSAPQIAPPPAPSAHATRYTAKVAIPWVALRTGKSPSEDQLRAYERKLLADYKVPERIFFLAELPRD